jgi:membrane-bound lytic murein transglycosylase F
LRAITGICLSVLLGSCSSPPSLLEQIVETGVLRVVTQNSPATFYYGNDAPRGIEYELARGFAERLGVRLDMRIADRFQELFPDIAEGKADIGAANLSTSASRADQVTFGPAYQQVRHQVVYRRGTKRPASTEDLVGGSLEILAGSSHAALLRRERARVPGLRWTEDQSGSAEALIRRVAQGKTDYTIVDSNEFQLLRHYYPEAKAAFSFGGINRVAWALPKNAPRLREEVAAYFAEIEATGKLERILDRHYFGAREFDYVGSRAFVRHLKTRLPRYRRMFEKAGARTGISWRLLAAISYQESHWNPAAVSPTGVRA